MRNYLPLLLLVFAAILLSACAGNSRAAAPLAKAADGNAYAGEASQTGGSGAFQQVAEPDNPSGDMVIFRGTVFVATSELMVKVWKTAGWRVSNLPLDTSQAEIPLDCTLYPHAGVANQWVGGCAGTVQVPRNGARDIAVRHTDEDGSNHVIQVAPAPGYP